MGTKTLYLCGAGNSEGVRLALAINSARPRWDRIVVLDDDPKKHGLSVLGVQTIGPLSLLEQADPVHSEIASLVARTTARRQDVRRKLEKYNLPFATLISPTVDTAGVELSSDVIVYQYATVGPEVQVDETAVVFMGAAVGHESKVGRCCVVAPNAVINARVQLGEGAYVGTNATVLPEVTVGPWATIAAGSVAMEDVPPGATVMGVPGEIILTMGQKAKMNGAGRLLASRLQDSGVARDVARPDKPGAKPRPALEQGFVAPRNEIEKRVARIWASVLHVDPVGVEDNFFHLGGASLATIEITTRLFQEFAVNIPIDAFLHAPTVAELSRQIEAKTMELAKGSTADELSHQLDVLPDEEVQALLADLVDEPKAGKVNGR